MNPFISYAQNFEDVLLWRALKHVKNGFYIDVGANDPEVHSVTKAFYERGWYGINIEPLPAFHPRFLQERPRDINLSLAAGASNGELTLYDVPQVRGWASPDAQVANQYQTLGYAITEITVPVRRLDSICQEHVDRPIHFLKIDVEGFESDVLRGMDFAQWRPWIVVVEATLPNSQTTRHEEWEHLLTQHGYLFAQFDGLNRYYVAPEQHPLLDIIRTPANVFDNFITVHLAKAWADAQQARDERNLANNAAEQIQQQLQTQQQQAHTRAASAAADHAAQMSKAAEHASSLEHTAQEQIHAIEHMAQQLQNLNEQAQHNAVQAQSLSQQLQALQTSLSWRITWPLRQISHQMRQLCQLPLRTWRWLRNQSQQTTLWLARHPLLRRLLLPRLAQFPALETRLAQHVAEIRQDPPPPAHSPEEAALPDPLRVLPNSARTIFADLTRHLS